MSHTNGLDFYNLKYSPLKTTESVKQLKQTLLSIDLLFTDIYGEGPAKSITAEIMCLTPRCKMTKPHCRTREHFLESRDLNANIHHPLVEVLNCQTLEKCLYLSKKKLLGCQ